MVGGDASARRRLCAACAAVLLGACAAGAPDTKPRELGQPAPDAMLVPWTSVDGARVALAADATGTPRLAAGPLTYHRFVHVASAAIFGSDLYVADSGAAAVFRMDLDSQVMTRVPAVAANLGTRLLVGEDYSLYVLDTLSRRVLRFARSGRLLATYAAGLDLASPVSVAVQEPGGAVYVADGLQQQIVAFHPLGGGARVIALRGAARNPVRSIAALAAGRDALYASDPACGCIARVAWDGTVLGTFGHGLLAQPGPIAADRFGRIYVADAFQRSLHVFVEGRLVRTWGAAAFGLDRLDDVKIAGESIALVDGRRAQVVLQRVLPPPARGARGSP